MNAFAFKVIDAINREGIGNEAWGLVEEVDDTVLRPEAWRHLPPVVKMKDMKDIKIGDPVRFGRNTGEYRGQFDKLNIAMVLVGNRLYYVTFEKIEKL